ncbi:MAG: hypothetical protein LBR27_02640 [Bifidobacteriaceae bacterium]|jgi:hypothetical protein|nr:hypothetical protein [Bifidobacteriaceae bacterium]
MNDQSLAKRLATAVGAFVLVASTTAGAIACSSTSDDAPPEHDGATPEEVVARYFEAIQAGDAAAALGCLAPTSLDETLLTDAVLQEAQRLAPVSDVEVADDYPNYATWNATNGTVTYTVGGQRVNAWIALQWQSNQWLIYPESALNQVDLGNIVQGSPAAEVNGVGDLAGKETVPTFPGGYQFDTGNPLVAYNTADGPYVVFAGSVLGLVDAGGALMGPVEASQQPSIIVTEAGQAAVAAAVEDKVEECVELGSDALASCGFHLTMEGDGTWAITEGDPSQWEIQAASVLGIWASNPTGIMVTCTDAAGEYCGKASVMIATIALSDPDNLTVILGTYSQLQGF